ncbi:MAG: S8 family serine peptidase [Cyanobacteria bacterium J06638_20]
MATAVRPQDPLFNQQWHLHNRGQTGGTPGIDLNVQSVWLDYTGHGVLVGVIDDGIDWRHPDLQDNYNRRLDQDVAENDADAQPTYIDDNHGTSVAGLIGGAWNGQGGVGVAPDVTLAGLRIDFRAREVEFEIEVEQAFQAMTQFDVVNNSWGYNFPFYDNFKANRALFGRFQEALQQAVRQGRNGLGTIVIFAGGNARPVGDSPDYHNLQNSRHTISVAALNHFGRNTWYSSPGASLLVSAFGGDGNQDGIVTTDRRQRRGYSFTNYTRSFGGTSAAAPMVAGVVALMLEANPRLGHRDVQEILAYSARQNHAQKGSWRTNGATTWNGGGLHTNRNYGFGLVDARAAVRLAETWTLEQTSRNQAVVQGRRSPNLSIPDGGERRSTIRLEPGVTVEQVDVVLNVQHTWVGDLEIVLTSPSGTSSILATRPGRDGPTSYGLSAPMQPFVFTSNEFWGESSGGTWTLTVRDRATQEVGTLKSWRLRAFGNQTTGNDLYIYTDEFATAEGTNRTTLIDTTGQDLLNAAAITTDLTINLLPGSQTSRLAGRSLTLGDRTWIEDAFGGDGNDRLSGNRLDNRLRGGRGRDTLSGLAGDDRLFGDRQNDDLSGDAGDDSLGGGQGRDRLLGMTGNDWLRGQSGRDTLLGGAGDDTLVGGAGADELTGGSGADQLQGQQGADIFRFATDGNFSSQALGIDRVLDFTSGSDRIALSRTTFSALSSTIGNGFSEAGEFVTVESDRQANRSSSLIVYSRSSGSLYYNANGAVGGFGGGGKFANLRRNPTLTASDFVLL